MIELVLGGAEGGGTHREVVSRSTDLIEFMAELGRKWEEDELVAKTFDSREQFEKEKKNLMLCKDDKGKEAIIQFKGEFEPGLMLYLEYAPGGSLKELLDEHPGGLR